MFCMNMLLTAKKLKSGSEKHCILSILIPAKITSLSVDITPIHFSAKRNKIIEAAVKKIVPIKTVVIKAFFTLEYCLAP